MNERTNAVYSLRNKYLIMKMLLDKFSSAIKWLYYKDDT